MSIVLLISVILLCVVVYCQSKQLNDQMLINATLVKVLEELDRKDKRLEARLTKVEQIATNAQNKATANQRRLEKGIIYESES